jgi:hypothetical protein
VETVIHFLWLLAVCNAFIPAESASASASAPYRIRFLASSPDEAALVLADTDFRFLFNAPASTFVVLVINGTEREILIFASINFTSNRKPSSISFWHSLTN